MRPAVVGVIVRPFIHIGPSQSADFVTASFARQIALNEAGQQALLLEVRNLQAERDFLDVRDVCGAYIKLLQLADKPATYPRCFNICSRQLRKIQNLLNTVRLTELTIEIVEDPERMHPSDIPSASGNINAIR